MKHLWTILATVLLLTALATTAFGAGEVTLSKSNIVENMSLSDGTYILGEDLELSETLTIAGEVTLYLNDHILEQTAIGKSVITISEDATLNLYDDYDGDGTSATVRDWTVDDTTGLWLAPVVHVDGHTNTTTGGVITGGSKNYGGDDSLLCYCVSCWMAMWPM